MSIPALIESSIKVALTLIGVVSERQKHEKARAIKYEDYINTYAKTPHP
jgi:hypothetical protein